jgi:act minimal PKS chain-length factor (CLF/KS beta)
LATAIKRALGDARCGAEEIDVVFADAGGTPELDRTEAAAIAEIFGARGVPVTAPKVAVGRMYAGGAAVDLATALLAIRDSVIPPTPGIQPLPDYQLDLVGDAPRSARIGTALVLARGFGGFNSAMVITAAG